MCMTRGATQYLYISHAGDTDGMDDAAIYKTTLDGKVVGRFGTAGKQLKEFGLANSIDCRDENNLLIGEMTNWRVQTRLVEITKNEERKRKRRTITRTKKGLLKRGAFFCFSLFVIRYFVIRYFSSS